MVMNFKCLPHFRSKRLRWGPYSCFVEIIDFGIGQRERGQAGLTVLYSRVRANFRRPHPFNYSSAGAQDMAALFPGQIKPPHQSWLCPPPATLRPYEFFMDLLLSLGLSLWLPAALLVPLPVPSQSGKERVVTGKAEETETHWVHKVFILNALTITNQSRSKKEAIPHIEIVQHTSEIY